MSYALMSKLQTDRIGKENIYVKKFFAHINIMFATVGQIG